VRGDGGGPGHFARVHDVLQPASSSMIGEKGVEEVTGNVWPRDPDTAEHSVAQSVLASRSAVAFWRYRTSLLPGTASADRCLLFSSTLSKFTPNNGKFRDEGLHCAAWGVEA
jgi:hypothetical protein